MSKNKKEILEKDSVFSICLAKKHPYNFMRINGVEVSGYQPKNYMLPAGTDLSSPEVKAWFKIDKALPEEEKKAPKKPAKDQ